MSTAKPPDTRDWLRVGAVMAIIGLALGGVMAVAVGPAAAADSADVDVVHIDNGTSSDGPLPDVYPDEAMIAVTNTTTDGTLSPSEVTFEPSNGASVNKTDPYPHAVEGRIDPADIPDDGLPVDVIVSGTTVDTVTVTKSTVSTSTATVTSTELAEAESINVTIDSNVSDGYRVEEISSTTTELRIDDDQGMVSYATFATDSGDVTVDMTSVQWWDDYSSELSNRSTSETTLYFDSSVQEIEIDGATAYSAADDPLGSTTGDSGPGTQTIILVAVAAGAALLVLRD